MTVYGLSRPRLSSHVSTKAYLFYLLCSLFACSIEYCPRELGKQCFFVAVFTLLISRLSPSPQCRSLPCYFCRHFKRYLHASAIYKDAISSIYDCPDHGVGQLQLQSTVCKIGAGNMASRDCIRVSAFAATDRRGRVFATDISRCESTQRRRLSNVWRDFRQPYLCERPTASRG